MSYIVYLHQSSIIILIETIIVNTNKNGIIMALQVSINGANRLLITKGFPFNISTDDRSINKSITTNNPRSPPPIADIKVDDAIEIIALFLYEYMYINLSFEYRPFSLSPL